MTGFTDTAARAILDDHVATYPWLALYTTVGSDTGSGFTEVSGGSYARVNTTGLWAYASGSAPSIVTNNSNIAFAQATANWGTVVGIGLCSAATSGVIGTFDYLGRFPWLPCNVTAASPAIIITDRTHGMLPGHVCVFSIEYGGTTPIFSMSNFTGLLTVAHAALTTLDVTNGGLAVNTSNVGSGTIRRVAPQTINSGSNFTMNPGDLTISLA